MAIARRYEYSKLLLGTLCSLRFLNSLCVDVAIERNIYTSKELQRRLQSSFYLLGYCASPRGPKCKDLQSLLESSAEQTRDSLIKTALVVYDAAYWQPDTTAHSIMLWFACYDGQQIRMKQFMQVAGLDMLADNLAAAAQQQGATCIAGQTQYGEPGAAAPAAEADITTMAFQNGLDRYHKQKQWWNWIVGFNFAVIVSGISVAALRQAQQPGQNEPSPGESFAAMVAAIAITVALIMGMNILLRLWGFEEPISWWWALPMFFMVLIVLVGLSAEAARRQHNSTAAKLDSSVAKSDEECTPLIKSSEAQPNGVCAVGGAPQVSTTESKSPATQQPGDMLV